MRYKTIQKFIVLGLIIGLGACSSKKEEPQPEADFDQAAMLTNYADNIIVPAYVALQEDVNALQTKVLAYEQSATNENLSALKSAYLETHLSWQSAAMFEFGPASDVLLRSSFNTFPVDTTQVNSNVSSGTYTLGAASNIDAKGLNTIDYLLYGSQSLSATRTKYLKDIVADLKTKIDYVVSNWANSYRAAFISNVGKQNGSSLGLAYNDFVLYAESYLRTGKIRIPAGILLGNVIDTTRIEAKYSRDYAFEYIQASLLAVNNCYLGLGTAGDQLGFDDYLQVLGTDYGGTKLYLQIRKEFQEALAVANRQTGAMADVLRNNRPEIVALHDEIQDVVGFLKVEMEKALSISITYQDTDGD